MKPNVVVLERIHEAGLGALRSFAKLTLAWEVNPETLPETLALAEVVVVRSATRVDDQFIASAPKLRLIARAGTGLENVDLVACAAAGVLVKATPGINSNATAELTIALMFAGLRELPKAFDNVARGDFRRQELEGRELAGRRVAVLGLGAVGSIVARILVSFGCQVIAFDPSPSVLVSNGGKVSIANSLESAIAGAEIITIHMPLLESTRGIFDDKIIRSVARGALIVNIARGAIVDDAAIIRALDAGHISRYICDVLDPEPSAESGRDAAHPLLGRKDVIVTPHIGASTVEAQRAISMAIANIVSTSISKGLFE